MKTVLIVAGESSGEKYGADVVREFKKIYPDFSFFGIGGQHMEAEGVELIFPIEQLSGIGIFEVLSSLPRIQRIFSRLESEIDSRRPAAAVLIDSPDFNLRLAKKLKRWGVSVLYYISPTVWAWRARRLKTIKRTVDRMLLIFPFEKPLYERHGISAVFVGHPLKQRVRIRMTQPEFFQKYSLSPNTPLVSLLPGSRQTELRNHWPVLRKTVDRIRAETSAAFLWVVADSIGQDWVCQFRASAAASDRVLIDDRYEAMAFSDLVLSACGTANLEAALLGTPLVAFYRLSPFTFYPFRPLVKIQNYSIVNILAGKRIIPELIQTQFNPERLSQEAIRLLRSDDLRAKMRTEFGKIQSLLGEEKAAVNAARELGNLIANRSF